MFPSLRCLFGRHFWGYYGSIGTTKKFCQRCGEPPSGLLERLMTFRRRRYEARYVVPEDDLVTLLRRSGMANHDIEVVLRMARRKS